MRNCFCHDCHRFRSFAAAPAFAEFNDRNIRVSNGINEDHPVGNGHQGDAGRSRSEIRWQAEVTAFWGGASAATFRRRRPSLRRAGGRRHLVLAARRHHTGTRRIRSAVLFGNAQRSLHGCSMAIFGRHDERELEGGRLVNLAYWENGSVTVRTRFGPVTSGKTSKG